MSSKRVTDRQVRRNMDSRKDGHAQAAAAARAGLSERTGRRIEEVRRAFIGVSKWMRRRRRSANRGIRTRLICAAADRISCAGLLRLRCACAIAGLATQRGNGEQACVSSVRGERGSTLSA